MPKLKANGSLVSVPIAIQKKLLFLARVVHIHHYAVVAMYLYMTCILCMIGNVIAMVINKLLVPPII